MDFMSIDYFSDLRFVCHGEISRTSGVTVRHDFSYWGIQFCRRGKFTLRIGRNRSESADDGCVFVTFPGQSFYYGAAAENEEIENKIFICFEGERVQRYLQGNLLQERTLQALLTLSDPDRFMRKMRFIRTLLMLPKSPENHARAVLALEQLLLTMKTDAGGSGKRRSDARRDAFDELTARIGAAPELPWDFEKESRKLSVSYAHFRRLFEQFYQLPPGAFLLSARLEKAAALLSSTTLMVQEVAHECGFEDEFYFSRIFKKYHQISPKLYRQNTARHQR
ncbi:MAG: helix-turn-helix transcriptional regulator [Lentisphaerae bacterium]|nr:helix-turn-helix transcriptional regulator [Lentisphaerota bacterium]